jgi:hypothetical protein
MIRRNVASQTIYLPKLALSADNSAVTSGASAVVSKDGTESVAAGTLNHYSGGVWKYTFDQAETDAAIVAIILTASGAEPVVLNLVTTAANTAAVAFGANTTTPDNAGIAAVKVVTDRINTGLVADGLVWQFTANMLELAPAGGGGGGSGDAEQATLLEVQSTVNSISSTVSSLSSLTASLPIKPGVIVGPAEPLVIGDDYTSAVGRQVRVNLTSPTGGSAATTFGSKSLSDAGISIQLLLRKSGQPSAVAQLVGTGSFFPAETVDGVEIPPYLLVSFSRTETAKATPGAYDMQAEAVWSSGDVVTFAPYGQIEFVRNIIRPG